MKVCICKSRKSPHFCPPTAAEVVRFFPRYLSHTKGRWAGKPFRLATWQSEQLIEPIFGILIWDSEIKAWVRQKRTAYVEIPRKSGKSSLGAGIALKLLFADKENGAEVYSVAEDTDQANVVFAMAKAMVEASEPLTKRSRTYKRLIEVPKTGNIYRVLPGDASGSHGLNVHGLVFDELHTQKHRELWDVMTSAQGTRTQPLTVALTTAGTDRMSICREQHDYGEQVASGVLEDPGFHYVRFGVPENGQFDWEDEQTWREANPALGDSISINFLRGEYRKAKASPGRQNAFRNLYLNEWTSSSVRWIDLAKWDESAGMVDETKLRGRDCYGGLDASHSTDIASLCWDFGAERIWRFWLPEDRLRELNEKTAGQAQGWVDNGFLKLTPGDVTDYSAIKNQIEADAGKFNVQEIGYNSHAILPLINELTEAEYQMVPISQGVTTLSAGTKELERQVLTGNYIHGGNPIVRYMIDGTVVRKDSDQNIKPDKEKSKVNITGVVAGVMALDRVLRHEKQDDGTSVYEDRDMVTF